MIGNLSHRPWPLPNGPWIMAQSWRNLLFAHWPLPATAMQALIPSQLALDTFDGEAWIGVVPFEMVDVHTRWLPSLPKLSSFPELNVRTYVRARDSASPKPGVLFFSLDAANSLAVTIARATFKLPYFHADMQCCAEQKHIIYRSLRIHANAPSAEFKAAYAPVGPVFRAQPGTLEHWLTERYCLYTVGNWDQLYRGEIHHDPWPLQPAEAEIQTNSMREASGIPLSENAPLLHFASHLNVAVWPLRRVETPHSEGP